MKTLRMVGRRDILFLLWGFFLWTAATVIFHVFGDRLIDAEHPAKTAASFIVAIPLIYMVTVPLYLMFHVVPSERLRCSACIAMPGMLLDILSLALHRAAFPAVSVDSMPLLAAWLLWAYSLILGTGFLFRR